ncbi:MAG: hypothetical protein EA420_14460 [Candidatus Competibacteraceae bacterium]|nr:MAG: hypothetical protein EA420_14460 [Candidatus Competibacteraceae bacterium]
MHGPIQPAIKGQQRRPLRAAPARLEPAIHRYPVADSCRIPDPPPTDPPAPYSSAPGDRP